jgi:hypothetical protein
MKKAISIFALLFIVLTKNIQAQNLVLNSSFENTASNCANFGGESFTSDLLNWDDANSSYDSCSSPDLFSACNLFVTNMPSSILGYQYAHSGTRYAGFITCELGGIDNYREYVEGTLSSPLVAGQTYCMSFYISLADNVAYATNNIGVYFTNSLYQHNACPGTSNSLINVTPQLNYSCSAITDTSAGWMRLQWSYTASGGERYFTIGNFFNSSSTTIVNTGRGGINPYAYYFIDDVSVIANSCCYAKITPRSPFCISDAPTNLAVTGGVGNSCIPTLNGTWSGTGITNATTGTFSPAVAGIGTFLISYTLPCGYVDTFRVAVNSCTAIAVCKETNGNLTVSGGTGPYLWSYYQPATSTAITNATTCAACGGSWTPFVNICLVGTTPSTSCTTPATWVQFATGVTATPPAGKDSIRVVDNAGTTVVMYGLATVPLCSPCPTITVTATPTNATCGLSNGSATTTVSGGASPYTYTWSNGGGSGSGLSNVSAGTYTVTVRDVNLCSATVTVTIGTTAGPTATSTKTDANCNGANNGTMTVTASGGTGTLTYTWSPNVSTTASATALPPNTYSVTVRDANNCTVVTSQTIGQPTAVTIATSNIPASCGGNNGSATATPSGGTGAYTYAWTGGATTATAANLAAGTYSVTVRDANLCSATASVTVGTSSALTIALTTTQPSCGNNNGKVKVTVSAGTGPYSYVWSNGAVLDSIINLAPNTYSVTVTGAGGCTASATTTLNTSSAITLSTTTTAATCGSNNGKAKVTILTGTGPYTYLWSNAATADSIVNVAGGAYQVTVTGAGGCSATATVTIANTGAPTLTLSAVNATCNGISNGSADVTTITGGTAPYTYAWNTGETTQGIVNKPAGTYTVTVTGSAGGSSTTVYAEDFDGASAANWQLNVATGVNGADPNFWKIDDEEGGVLPPGCGVANNGNKTLFVTSVFNPNGGAAYDAGGLCGILFCPQTNAAAVSPVNFHGWF